MKFHEGSRFGLCEKRQSLIFWSCQNIDLLPLRTQKILRKLIEECADGEEKALEEALCTKKSLTEISLKYYISESGLQRRCDKFYKKAEKVIR